MRKCKLRIEKSGFPEKEKDHILILESMTNHGWNYKRIFKGTKEECLEKKKEMEEKKCILKN